MNKRKKHILIIVISLILLSTILGIIDYNQVKNNKKPIFMIRISDSSKNIDGYLGLGYRFKREVQVSINEPIDKTQNLKFGLWFYLWNIYENMDLTDSFNKGNFEFETKLSEKRELKQIIFPEKSSYYKGLLYRLFTYELDEINITIDNQKYSLEKALGKDKITIENIENKLKYNLTHCNCADEMLVDEGGANLLYISNSCKIKLLKCNNINAEKGVDYYISDVDTELGFNFCK